MGRKSLFWYPNDSYCAFLFGFLIISWGTHKALYWFMKQDNKILIKYVTNVEKFLIIFHSLHSNCIPRSYSIHFLPKTISYTWLLSNSVLFVVFPNVSYSLVLKKILDYMNLLSGLGGLLLCSYEQALKKTKLLQKWSWVGEVFPSPFLPCYGDFQILSVEKKVAPDITQMILNFSIVLVNNGQMINPHICSSSIA